MNFLCTSITNAIHSHEASAQVSANQKSVFETEVQLYKYYTRALTLYKFNYVFFIRILHQPPVQHITYPVLSTEHEVQILIQYSDTVRSTCFWK